MFKKASQIFVSLFIVLAVAGCSYFDTGPQPLSASSSDLDMVNVQPIYEEPNLSELFYLSTDGRVRIYDLDEPVPAYIQPRDVTLSAPEPVPAHREPIQTLAPQVKEETPLLDLATSPFASPEEQGFTAPDAQANDSSVEIFTLN